MNSHSRFLAVAILLLFIVGLVLTVPPRQAAAQKETSPTFSDSALRQIQSLINEKESRSAAQKKLDSQLIYAARQNRGEAITSELRTLDVNVNIDSKGLIPVDIKATVSNNLIDTITSLGGEIIFVAKQYRSVTARVPLQAIESIAGLNEVQFIYPADQARTHGFNGSGSNVSSDLSSIHRANFAERTARVREQLTRALLSGKLATTLAPRAAPAPVGPVNSQGDTTHRAGEARLFFGLTGAGVTIGVLSNGVASLAAEQANGELGPVTVLPGQAGTGNEGTAMLEIVHDLAPGAQLFFATAFTSQASFAQNVLDLRTAGCDIIVDDVGYYREAVFQDDNVAQSVDTVTAAGALYFSSAGNEGNKDDNTSGVWEGDFSDSGTGTLGTVTLTGGTVHDFGAGTTNDQLTVSNGGAPIGLFWSDQLGASGNDYDLYILDAGLTTVVNASTNVQDGNDDPVELSSISPAAGRRLVIFRKTGAATRALHLNSFRGRLAINTTGQTHGHSSAVEAFSVAATPAAGAIGGPPNPTGPFPLPFNGTNLSEVFTSDGPRRIFYNPDGTPITPGNLLFGTNGGTLLQKPEITAADGVATGVSGFNPFFGTSAAAPHAAAIAALLKSANGALTPAQIRTALTSSAIDIESAGVDRDTGAGIVMAFEALQAIGATPQPSLTSAGATLVTESCAPANGVIDPGETVTVSLCVQNIGGLDTTNLVGTLQVSGGVTSPSGPQTYGAVVAGGPPVCRNFTFNASGSCGGVLTASLQLQDGAANLGTLTYTFNLGIAQTAFSENFDAVSAPALPAGWVSSTTNGAANCTPTGTCALGSQWATSATSPDTGPNSAFHNDPSCVTDNTLDSPSIAIQSTSAQLIFRNKYNTESTFDGAVLEMSIDGGAFQDIITAGGSFVTGGYNGTISVNFLSPIAGRQAWTGNSGAFITTKVNLPAAAAGHNIKLRFRLASDCSVGVSGGGQNIDTISITDGFLCCSTTTSSGASVPWTGLGSSGTVDEADFARADLNSFVAGIQAGQTGAVTVRYNIVATHGVSRFCPASSSNITVRYRDSDAPGVTGRVFFTIRASNINTGGNTVVYTFDSNVSAMPLGPSFQTTSTTVPLDFDFANNVYWIEAEISRTDPTLQVQLGSIQIAEIAGAACP